MRSQIAILIVLMALIGLSDAQYINNIMKTTALQNPCIFDARSVMDNIHIGVTLAPQSWATSEELSIVTASLIGNYVQFLRDNPAYTGYLRIGIAPEGVLRTFYELTAWDVRSIIGQGNVTADMGTLIFNRFLSSEKTVTYSRY